MEPDPAGYIGDSEAVRILLRHFARYQSPHALKFLRHHADAVVLHDKYQVFAFLPAGDADHSLAALVLDPVVEGIFHNRLEHQFHEIKAFHAVRNPYFVIQYIRIAEFLYFQITPYMALLFRNGNPVMAFAESSPEEQGQ